MKEFIIFILLYNFSLCKIFDCLPFSLLERICLVSLSISFLTSFLASCKSKFFNKYSIALTPESIFALEYSSIISFNS